MFGLASELYEWTENSKGNFVGRDSSGDVVATVFSNGSDYAWQIIINRDGRGHIVTDEAFDDPEDATERADAILDGAECTLTPVKPSVGAVTTGWKEQKTIANGSPTYGRKFEGMGISVKKATSGQWYYVTYSGSDSSPPQGWFNTAQEAMQAFDAQYR